MPISSPGSPVSTVGSESRFRLPVKYMKHKFKKRAVLLSAMGLIKKQEKIAYYIYNNIWRTYIVRKSYKPKTFSLISYGQSFNPGFFKMAVTSM